MPEGDSIAGDAAMLRPILVGEVVESVDATSGSVRANVGRILGRTVTGIRTRGKNLVVDFDSGYSLWVHLGMNGRWQLLDRDHRAPGPAKVALTTRAHQAVCFGAPKAEVGRTPAIDLALGSLGPDLLSEEVDYEDILRRVRALPQRTTLARMLLDQTIAAGIGNVYKSELAFLAGVLPSTPIEKFADEQLLAIYKNAQDLLLTKYRLRDPIDDRCPRTRAHNMGLRRRRVALSQVLNADRFRTHRWPRHLLVSGLPEVHLTPPGQVPAYRVIWW